jgi:hypothetical protein
MGRDRPDEGTPTIVGLRVAHILHRCPPAVRPRAGVTSSASIARRDAAQQQNAI